LAFNQNLVTEELAAESAAFGGNDSALNGAVDRMINIDNLYLATGESSFNGVLGANYSPAELTASVPTGDTGYTGTDPTTFTAAIGDLYDVTVFSNLARDFAIMSADFGTVLTSLF
jgi:hypothetical protein